MVSSLGHLLRLWQVGRTLAAYRALGPLRAAPGKPWILSFALWLLHFGPRRSDAKDLPEGRRMARALEELGPAYIKLGQALATRPDAIGPEMAKGLQTLQDRVEPFPTEVAHETLTAEFGADTTQLYAEFSDTPIAAASIAQVHKAVTSDGRNVAVKILRPGIETRFGKDLATFRWGAEFIKKYVPRSRRLRPDAVVQTLEDSVAEELDLRMEAAHSSSLAGNMTGTPDYYVPAVDWERTGQRVLTTEWIDGVPVTDMEAMKAQGIDVPALGPRLVQIFLIQAMRDGFFHADMHQGNLLISTDGTINALDFGIMGRLDRETRRVLALILYGFIQRDYQRIAEVHFEAGYVDPDQSVESFATALRAIGEPIMGRPLHDISVARLLTQLLVTTERYSMRTQPHLIMLQKTMVMVEGLAYSLDPNLNMWETARPVLEDWVEENLSPEVQLADGIVETVRTLKAMPGRLASLEKALIDTPAPPVQSNRDIGLIVVAAAIAFALGAALF